MKKEIFDSPSGKIFRFILQQGEVTIKEIEEGLVVTRNAIRPQLDSLIIQGLIGSRLVKTERGRPYNLFYVTEIGRDSLPDQYKSLFRSIWQEINSLSDSTLKDRLMEVVSTRMAEEYEIELRGVSPEDRLNRFIELLNTRGIPTQIKEEEDSFEWKEYICPYYQVAKADPDVCRMELEMMKKVLGKEVERHEWIMKGSSGCKFRINKDSNINPLSQEDTR